MVVRRPGEIVEINSNSEYVRLYAVDQRDHIDVIVMTANENAVEYGFMQVDDYDIVFTDKEDIRMLVKALLKGNSVKRNVIVYYDEYDDWLLYWFKAGRLNDENVLFAASDDTVYPLGPLESALDAATEVDEKLREIVASFISQLPL